MSEALLQTAGAAVNELHRQLADVRRELDRRGAAEESSRVPLNSGRSAIGARPRVRGRGFARKATRLRRVRDHRG